jgi:hypothetical protein
MTIVRYIKGRIVNLGGEEHSGWLPNGAATPIPTPIVRVEFDILIDQEVEGSCLLIRNSRQEGYSGDTWHPSMPDAIDKATVWLGIELDEWQKGSMDGNC